MPRAIRWTLLIAVVGFGLAVAALGQAPRRADAHPLGNFTINHYARIDVSENGIELFRVLDMAEIPAFQEQQRMDRDGGGVSEPEGDEYAASKASELLRAMTLRVNGDSVALAESSRELAFLEGQGGLSTLRLEVTYTAALPDGWRVRSPRVEFADENYAERAGWREIVVRGGPGVEIVDSSAPSVDTSAALTAYPEGSLSSPLDVRTATFAFEPGAGAALPSDERQDRATRGNPDATLAQFTELIGRDELSAGVVLLALAGAMAFGAIHALSPGHGKTIVAAYLVGSRGTAKHALLLGLTVTATHTSSVYVLGFVTLYLSAYVVPETLYPWLGVTSGGVILLMGASLLVSRVRSSGLLRDAVAWMRARLQRAGLAIASSESGALLMATPSQARGASGRHAHAGGREGPGASHEHDDGSSEHKHGWGPAHSHAIPGEDGEPVTWRRLVGLGVFGGMIPCPSAIVVMLSAIALHRVAFGLVLIVAFSLGLAAVLTGIGFALVYARAIGRRVPVLRRMAERVGRGGVATSFVTRAFPSIAASAVVAAGIVITMRAVGSL